MLTTKKNGSCYFLMVKTELFHYRFWQYTLFVICYILHTICYIFTNVLYVEMIMKFYLYMCKISKL